MDSGLNPYSDGRCSKRLVKANLMEVGQVVLILILMEDALRDLEVKVSSVEATVLILILMEDALRDI